MTRASEVVSSAFAVFRARETRVRVPVLFSFFSPANEQREASGSSLMYCSYPRDEQYRCIRHKNSGVTPGTRRIIFLYRQNDIHTSTYHTINMD